MQKLQKLAPLWIASMSLAISGIVAFTTPLPEPQVHDEFSYLLAADTFARGRLTNRTHPLWEFFETFHVVQQPTYMSKYPPGQGLLLALGKVVAGVPLAGVWMGSALACVAMYWALTGLMPRRWAFLGALIAATHPVMLRWNWSYWGGVGAAAGGAIVLGAIARLSRTRRPAAAIWLGVGVLILAITRPFEGAVFLLLVASFLRLQALPSAAGSWRRAAVVLLTTLALGGAWIGYYNWRITRSVWRTPYLVYEATYGMTPPFIWMPRTREPPAYRHETMRRFNAEWELQRLYLRQRTLPGLFDALGEKLWDFSRAFFASPALLAPLALGILALRRDRIVRPALIVAALFTLVVFGNLSFFPHYAAPAVAVYLLIVVQGLRHLRALRHGRSLVRAIVVLHVAAAIVWWSQLDRTSNGWNYARAAFIEDARKKSLPLLVIVRPGADYYAHNEWVYNDADIDASPVVWARDMGERNQLLLDYFPIRQAILLEIDENTMRFSRYPR